MDGRQRDGSDREPAPAGQGPTVARGDLARDCGERTVRAAHEWRHRAPAGGHRDVSVRTGRPVTPGRCGSGPAPIAVRRAMITAAGSVPLTRARLSLSRAA